MDKKVDWYSDIATMEAKQLGDSDLEMTTTHFGIKDVYKLLEYPTLEMFSLLSYSFVRFQPTQEYPHLLKKGCN